MDRFQIIKGEEPPEEYEFVKVTLTPEETSAIIDGQRVWINKNNDAYIMGVDYGSSFL